MASAKESAIPAARRLEPLAGRMFADNGVSAAAAPAAERIALRVGSEGMADAKKILGFALPQKPGSTATRGDCLCLWIGPDEWLVIDAAGSGIASRFARLGNTKLSAVDVSHRNTAILLNGAKAATVLNSGCPRDLSLEAFPAGTASRTVLGKSEIILYREAADSFRIECWRSFSDYVWSFLADAIKSV